MATIINARSTLATDPIRNFRFLVNFFPHNEAGFAKTGLSTASVGFTSVSGLAQSTESIPYREGGYNSSVHQIPGQTTHSPVTFQRGVMVGNQQGIYWMRRLYSVIQGYGVGTVGDDFRVDIDIRVLQHPTTGLGEGGNAQNAPGQSEIVGSGDDISPFRVRLFNAWPTALAFSDLNAGDNALLVEQMTVVHEGMYVVLADGITASAVLPAGI